MREYINAIIEGIGKESVNTIPKSKEEAIEYIKGLMNKFNIKTSELGGLGKSSYIVTLRTSSGIRMAVSNILDISKISEDKFLAEVGKCKFNKEDIIKLLSDFAKRGIILDAVSKKEVTESRDEIQVKLVDTWGNSRVLSIKR